MSGLILTILRRIEDSWWGDAIAGLCLCALSILLFVAAGVLQ